MKAMAKHRSHSIEFKRQVAQEYVAGETLHALAKRLSPVQFEDHYAQQTVKTLA
jgi:hypothetical protein